MIKTSKKTLNTPSNIIIIVIIHILTVIGFMAGIQAIRDIINGTDK